MYSEAEMERLIKENTPLIYFVYNRYIFKSRIIKRNEEDLISVGMEALWKGIEGYDSSKGALSTFLCKVIYTKMLQTIKLKINKKRVDEISLDSNEFKQYETKFYYELEYEYNDFKDVIKNLRSAEQKVIELVINGYTYKEIGDKYGGLSRQAIEQVYKRALNKLRRELKPL